MRPPKAPRFRFHSAWEFVGSDVLRLLHDAPRLQMAKKGDLVSGSEQVAVMVAAINPAALAVSVRNESTRELATVFTGFYAKYPELTLRLLDVIRKRWNEDSITAKVQRHILTKSWHQRPIVKDGNWIQEGIFHHDASDTDVQAVVIDPKKRLKKVTDASAVKKARQRIRLPAQRPFISVELNSALRELQTRGFEVGLG